MDKSKFIASRPLPSATEKLSIAEIDPPRLKKVDDQELLNLHRRMHMLFGRTRNVSDEAVVNAHIFIMEEMARRGMNHNMTDNLDKESQRLLKKDNSDSPYNENYFASMQVLKADFVSDLAGVIPLLRGTRVLELGSGVGKALEILTNSGFDATGIDASDYAVTACREKGLSVTKDDASDLPFRDNYFDSCFSMHLLEHLDEPEKAIQESMRVARYRAVHLVPLGKRQDPTHKQEFMSTDELRDLVKGIKGARLINKVSGNNAVIVFDKDLSFQEPFFEQMDDFIVIPDFISLVGSAVKGKEPQDIDILFRQDWPDSSMEVKMRNLFDEGIRERLHYIYNSYGPHDDHIPLYDLVAVRKKEFGLREMSKREIAPLTRFTPLKTKGGYNEQEFFDRESLWEFWAQGLIEKGIVVEQKFNGFRTILEAKGKETLIYFEDAKEDRSRVLPSVAKELLSIGRDIILDAEMIEYVKGKPISRKDMVRWAQSREPLDDSGIVVHVFDCLYDDGEDLHDLPWSKRQESLDRVFSRKFEHLIRVEPKIVKSKDGLFAEVKRVSALPGSEGAVLKVSDSDYPLRGQTESWAKIKNLVEIDVQITDKKQVKGAEAWNYLCAVLDKGELTPIGKTFNTTLNAKVGDIITVGVEEIIVDEKDGKRTISWVVPIVRNLKPERKTPMSFEEVVEEARKGRILQASLLEKVRKPGTLTFKEDYEGEYIIHEHQRGKSLHSDLRMHALKPVEYDHLEGLTLDTPGNTEQRSKIREPKEGEKILTQIKQHQPLAWMKVEGEFPPGSVGATRFEEGIFTIIDRGKFRCGVQEPHFKEFWFEGGVLTGRWILTYVPVPPEWEKAGEEDRVWLFSRPKDQTMQGEREQETKKFYCPIIKVDREQRIVTGVVLQPEVVDAQGDIISEEVIAKAAHTFLQVFNVRTKIGFMHTVFSKDLELIESYIAPQPIAINGQMVKKGSWVMSVKVIDDDVWENVKQGKIRGFSIKGKALVSGGSEKEKIYGTA